MAVAPPLTERQQLAMRAFHDLTGERGIASEFLGPIYWRAIAAWCERYAVPDSETFIDLVQAIDREYLSENSSANSNRKNPRHAQGVQQR